ncbi:hypothetical protein [Wohlfahrtiimonas chitiniclastica]|uniref:hypothetical protein n=1 Tax=Wohlfahrtiimonas chitiniclastica TaxID=400946 RepID=UPI000B9828A8|nr:hypothetical protein [Wohlfahrtiimonas chitiniclastica]OYQ76110.1 hypothetical protein B9T18_01765 [Wohlfahrtiimonas chitiniclastica]
MANINILVKKMDEKNIKSVLFNFIFSGLKIRGIFYSECRSMTLGIEEQNLGWQPEIAANGHINQKIPEDIFFKNINLFKQEDKPITTKHLFIALGNAIDNLKVLNPPNQKDAFHLLGMCITNDKKYDNEGSKPYFWHWKRVKPSTQNLEKIARYFGSDIKNSCIKLGKTAVWSNMPQKDSFCFSNKNTAEELLNQ